jgi:hypothetical protein
MNFEVAIDLYQFAVDLCRVVENENPIKQGMMLDLGRRKGLRIKTLARIAKYSESHVRRMLRLPDVQ